MARKNIRSDKRGWIRIVEAFVAVLLIAGVVLVILDKGYIGKADISEEIYEEEDAILREIQLNDSLRGSILGAGPLPVNWSNMPDPVKGKINAKTPSYLDCEAQICVIDDDCMLSKTLEKDIYARSVAITSTSATYDARQLKMFCWLKG
jgi:hypothetical protein